MKKSCVLIVAVSLGKNKDFLTMLAYINTNKDQQKKGESGRER